MPRLRRLRVSALATAQAGPLMRRAVVVVVVLWLSALAGGCGGGGEEGRGDGRPGAERLKVCLRDAGVSLERLRPLRVSHAPFERERFRAKLQSGDSAVVRVLASSVKARRQARVHVKGGSAATLQKGAVVLRYFGRSAGTTVLEDCLRESATAIACPQALSPNASEACPICSTKAPAA